MKLFLDEMLSARVARRLRDGGHDVVAVTERPELKGTADAELFERAAIEGRAIVTYNRDDFLALDRLYRSTGRIHGGIIILNPRRFPQGAAAVGSLIASLAKTVDDGVPYPSFVSWLR